MSKVKLSKTQQEVVDYMAAGWELSLYRGYGGDYSLSLAPASASGRSRRVRVGTEGALLALGAIAAGGRRGTHTEYRLTALGRSLAKPIEVKATTTWWLVSRYSQEPCDVEVESSTDAMLVIKGHRTKMHADYENYFPTREEAVACICSRLEAAVVAAEQSLKAAKQELQAFKNREAQGG